MKEKKELEEKKDMGNENTSSSFFPPIPRSYTSSPLDGMAWNYIYFLIYLDTQELHNLLCLDAFIPTSYARV